MRRPRINCVRIWIFLIFITFYYCELFFSSAQTAYSAVTDDFNLFNIVSNIYFLTSNPANAVSRLCYDFFILHSTILYLSSNPHCLHISFISFLRSIIFISLPTTRSLKCSSSFIFCLIASSADYARWYPERSRRLCGCAPHKGGTSRREFGRHGQEVPVSAILGSVFGFIET